MSNRKRKNKQRRQQINTSETGSEVNLVTKNSGSITLDKRQTLFKSITPFIMAISLLALSFLLVTNQILMIVVGLIGGLIGVLGTLDRKTPIGQQVFNVTDKLLGDDQVKEFFALYKKSLIEFLILSSLLMVCLMVLYVETLLTPRIIIMNMYIFGVVTLFLFVFRSKEKRYWFKGFMLLFSFVFAIFILGRFSTEIINQGRINFPFTYIKSSDSGFDPTLTQSRSVDEYAKLLELWYLMDSRANMFILQYDESKEDYDLWGPINWESTKAIYIFDATVFEELELKEIPSGVFEEMSILDGEEFVGHIDFFESFRDVIGENNAQRYRDIILEQSIRSEQKQRENEFKKSWQKVEEYFDPQIVEIAKDRLEVLFSGMGSRIYVLPAKIQPSYITSQLIAIEVVHISSLATITKIVTRYIFTVLIEQGKIIIVMFFVLVIIFISYLFSKALREYNIKYNRDYLKQDTLFFIINTIISLVLALYPLIMVFQSGV